MAILLQGAVFVGMILARDVRLEDRVRHLEHSPRCLVNRDVGPITYDVATHQTKAMVAEYRGFLHWHRDVSEKLLSIVLVFGFNLFLAKIIGYFYDYAHGDAWRLCFIAVDVGIAIGFIGLSLIVDGIVLIGAMTDAPGIGRTLDSMIVVLAGVVVLLLDVEPKESSLVSFSLGKDPWLSVGLAGITGVLFLVRWVIRHRTIAELMGERSPRGEA